MLVAHEAIVDGRHDEVGNSAASITKASRQCIGGADNVLVKETSGPDLARHETAAEDTNEKADGHQPRGIFDAAGAESGNGTGNKNAGESLSRSESVTGGSRYQADEETFDRISLGSQYAIV